MTEWMWTSLSACIGGSRRNERTGFWWETWRLRRTWMECCSSGISGNRMGVNALDSHAW